MAEPSPSEQSVPPLTAMRSWLAGFAVGLAEAFSASPEERRQRALARWRESLLRIEAGAAPADEPALLAALQSALTGHSRGYVVGKLGQPPASFVTSATMPGGKPPHYWQADVWYYPLNLRRRRAVAITFVEERVYLVELLSGPK